MSGFYRHLLAGFSRDLVAVFRARFDTATVRRLTPWQVAHLWTSFPDMLTPGERQDLLILRHAHPDFEQAYPLAQTFINIIHNRLPAKLNQWLQDALNSTVTPFITLANGLHRDKAAVRAGITLP